MIRQWKVISSQGRLIEAFDLKAGGFGCMGWAIRGHGILKLGFYSLIKGSNQVNNPLLKSSIAIAWLDISHLLNQLGGQVKDHDLRP